MQCSHSWFQVVSWLLARVGHVLHNQLWNVFFFSLGLFHPHPQTSISVSFAPFPASLALIPPPLWVTGLQWCSSLLSYLRKQQKAGVAVVAVSHLWVPVLGGPVITESLCLDVSADNRGWVSLSKHTQVHVCLWSSMRRKRESDGRLIGSVSLKSTWRKLALMLTSGFQN